MSGRLRTVGQWLAFVALSVLVFASVAYIVGVMVLGAATCACTTVPAG